MAEGTTDEVKDIDIIVRKLDKWTEEIKGEDKCPSWNTYVRRYEQSLRVSRILRLKYIAQEEMFIVSTLLSDILPKLDDSLFYIDDILYPDQKWSDFETNRSVFYGTELFERIDMSRYFTSYYSEVNEYATFGNILYDYTLLKVVKHMPMFSSSLYNTLNMLLNSGNERAVCFGLKFLRTVLKGNFAERVKTREFCSLMSNYRDIPIPEDPIKHKIALFIAKQANECYKNFHDEYKVPEENLSSKRKIIDSIHFILYYCDFEMPICRRNILYTIFTSAEDEAAKCKCLEWFVRAIDTSCLRNLFEGFKVLTTCLLGSVGEFQSRKKDNILRLIDMKCGRKIEPYLPGVDVPIESEKLWNDEKNEDETDYTLEKFFLYDEVMKNLHLLKIFYAAAAECNKKICEQEFDDMDYTEAFRNDYWLQLIGSYLINKDRQIPWYLEKTLEMCPFIIFPHKDMELAFDLIRVLRRDNDVSQSEKLSEKIKQMEDFWTNIWKEPIKVEKTFFWD